MWQRFTERARRVVLSAQNEASTLGSPKVGTEHLLLGLLREDEGVAAIILTRLNVSLDTVRALVPAEATRAEEGRDPLLTKEAKIILELAADEARRMKHNYIGTEHLLLGLLREDGTAQAILHRLGLRLETMRPMIEEYLDDKGSNEDQHPLRDDSASEIFNQSLQAKDAKIAELQARLDEARRANELMMQVVHQLEGIAQSLQSLVSEEKLPPASESDNS